MTNWMSLIQPATVGVVVAVVTAKVARPAQKETVAQQQMASVLQSAPALLAQGRELLAANATLQTEILTQKNTIELLTDRVGGLEKQVEDLKKQCESLAVQAERVPQLEREVAGLRLQLADKEHELEHTRIERDMALRAQERAEGGLMQAQRTISEKVCVAEPAQTSDVLAS